MVLISVCLCVLLGVPKCLVTLIAIAAHDMTSGASKMSARRPANRVQVKRNLQNVAIKKQSPHHDSNHQMKIELMECFIISSLNHGDCDLSVFFLLVKVQHM